MEPRPPTRGSDIAWGVSIAVMVTDLALLAGLALGTIRARAGFSKIFDDFEAELPAMTQWLMSAPGWLILLGALAAAAAMLLKERLVRDARVNLLVNLTVLVGVLALGAALALALLLPLMTLIEQLS